MEDRLQILKLPFVKCKWSSTLSIIIEMLPYFHCLSLKTSSWSYMVLQWQCSITTALLYPCSTKVEGVYSNHLAGPNGSKLSDTMVCMLRSWTVLVRIYPPLCIMYSMWVTLLVIFLLLNVLILIPYTRRKIICAKKIILGSMVSH